MDKKTMIPVYVKKYLVYAWEEGWAEGGPYDIIGGCETIEECKELVEDNNHCNNVVVLDLETGMKVYEKCLTIGLLDNWQQ